MDLLKKMRKNTRMVLTRTVNELDAELGKDAPDRDQFVIILQRLDTYHAKLMEQDEKLLEFMANADATEDEFGLEMEGVVEYGDRVARVKLNLGNLRKFMRMTTSTRVTRCNTWFSQW
jgi:hypothetical protein